MLVIGDKDSLVNADKQTGPILLYRLLMMEVKILYTEQCCSYDVIATHLCDSGCKQLREKFSLKNLGDLPAFSGLIQEKPIHCMDIS